MTSQKKKKIIEKKMVLVDYIGIFTCGNIFGHILYKIFMKNVQFLRKSTACK